MSETNEMQVQTDIKVFTLKEAAQIIRISSRTLHGYLLEGKLRGARIGTSWRITEEAIKEFLYGGAEILDVNRRAEHQGTAIMTPGSQLPHSGNNGGGRRKKASSDGR